MRGKPHHLILQPILPRITPAHAGKTQRLKVINHCELGSPPRMRGKQECPFPSCVHRRITPAHAGKTVYPAVSARCRWDHPRACGENRNGRSVCCWNRGITPAHAGKTFCHTFFAGCVKDHPRACGENCTCDDTYLVVSGSPPRMRGKPFRGHTAQSGTWITPAHAGKTKACSLSTNTAWDHPRACGENRIMHWATLWRCGSPPRMRGKRSRRTTT